MEVLRYSLYFFALATVLAVGVYRWIVVPELVRASTIPASLYTPAFGSGQVLITRIAARAFCYITLVLLSANLVAERPSWPYLPTQALLLVGVWLFSIGLVEDILRRPRRNPKLSDPEKPDIAEAYGAVFLLLSVVAAITTKVTLSF